jgi:outer membrane lipopolysaccharide assembly protein LptE/RlpB
MIEGLDFVHRSLTQEDYHAQVRDTNEVPGPNPDSETQENNASPDLQAGDTNETCDLNLSTQLPENTASLDQAANTNEMPDLKLETKSPTTAPYSGSTDPSVAEVESKVPDLELSTQSQESSPLTDSSAEDTNAGHDLKLDT